MERIENGGGGGGHSDTLSTLLIIEFGQNLLVSIGK